MRWQHFLALHTDNIQKPAKSPGCLPGEITQLSEIQLTETSQTCPHLMCGFFSNIVKESSYTVQGKLYCRHIQLNNVTT